LAHPVYWDSLDTQYYTASVSSVKDSRSAE